MVVTGASRTLGDLLDDEQVHGALVTPSVEARDLEVNSSLLHVGGWSVSGGEGTEPIDPSCLVIHVSQASTPESFLAELRPLLDREAPALLAIWPPDGLDHGLLEHRRDQQLLVVSPPTTPTDLISAVARLNSSPGDVLTRRLTSVQRSLTQALSEPQPLTALVQRVARTCRAGAALITDQGAVEQSGGPLPLSLLAQEVGRVPEAPSHVFDIQGWRGIGVRVVTDSEPGIGWLVVASRRDSFPDPYATAAAFVAASLVETNTRLDLVYRRQDRAVRGALLEQALGLRLERHDNELEGRMGALGLTFDSELRVMLVRQAGDPEPDRAQAALETMHHRLETALDDGRVPHLLLRRSDSIVGLIQATTSSIRRTAAQLAVSRQGFEVGIGRTVPNVGAVVDSYDDARLAVRTIRRQSGAGAVLAYEDFGFAMRLVSDVGTEKMGTWAEQLLGPLDGQPLLLEGLREYFDSQLNIIAAAKNLNVHHNSLRYRLSRVEELLQVKLRDPATVTALFLALTARALDDESPDTRRPAPLRRPRSPGAQPPEDRSPGVVTDPREPGQPEHLGAAVGPDR